MTNEELCILIAQGHEDKIITLWEQTDKLFYMFARRMYSHYSDRAVSHGVELNDCFQVCWFAFLDTLVAYNKKPERDKKFTSFACLHVKRHIYILLGLRTSKREPLDYAMSLDAPLPTDEENLTVMDTIADTEAEKTFEKIECSDMEERVLERVATLPEKQAAVVRERFWKDKTLTEISKELGITPKQMYNQYKDVIRKLRRDQKLKEIHREFYVRRSFIKHTGFQFFKETGMSSVEWNILRLEELITRARGGDEDDRRENHFSAEENQSMDVSAEQEIPK
jgi:RNA polymerase sigma factor (sigma-70 family)